MASNQVGIHHDRRSSYGHSMVVDPWGDIVKLYNILDLDWLNE